MALMQSISQFSEVSKMQKLFISVHWTECYVSPNLYVQILAPSEMVLGSKGL